MNAYFATRICGYVALTGAFIALGTAFGQGGLIVAGVMLLIFAAMLFNECAHYQKVEEDDCGENSES